MRISLQFLLYESLIHESPGAESQIITARKYNDGSNDAEIYKNFLRFISIKWKGLGKTYLYFQMALPMYFYPINMITIPKIVIFLN